MIEGRFGDEEELFFEIELIAADGLELTVDAMLDTGFSGWLAIDKQDLEGLGWVKIGEQNMRRKLREKPNLFSMLGKY